MRSMKILVVKYRFIGDTILSIPFLRNLRRSYPDAQIDMLVSPGSGEILEDCPYINHLIYFDTTRKYKYEKSNEVKKSFWHYVSLLKQEKYDKAYILKRSLSSALLCFLSGIKERIGFSSEFRDFLLTKSVKYDRNKHESLCYLDVLTADNIKADDFYMENWISDKTSQEVRELFEANNIPSSITKAVVNITATNEKKVWDIYNFAKVIEYLSNEKGIQVIYIGASNDRELYENIPYSDEIKIKPLNLCGALNLHDALAVIKEADFILGNDTGNLHMASAVGTQCIALFGPMNAEKWKPLGNNNIILQSDRNCVPCNLRKKCKIFKACMNDISIEQVINAIDSLVNNIKANH